MMSEERIRQLTGDDADPGVQRAFEEQFLSDLTESTGVDPSQVVVTGYVPDGQGGLTVQFEVLPATNSDDSGSVAPTEVASMISDQVSDPESTLNQGTLTGNVPAGAIPAFGRSGVCGNGMCEFGEDDLSCPADCAESVPPGVVLVPEEEEEPQAATPCVEPPATVANETVVYVDRYVDRVVEVEVPTTQTVWVEINDEGAEAVAEATATTASISTTFMATMSVVEVTTEVVSAGASAASAGAGVGSLSAGVVAGIGEFGAFDVVEAGQFIAMTGALNVSMPSILVQMSDNFVVYMGAIPIPGIGQAAVDGSGTGELASNDTTSLRPDSCRSFVPTAATRFSGPFDIPPNALFMAMLIVMVIAILLVAVAAFIFYVVIKYLSARSLKKKMAAVQQEATEQLWTRAEVRRKCKYVELKRIQRLRKAKWHAVGFIFKIALVFYLLMSTAVVFELWSTCGSSDMSGGPWATFWFYVIGGALFAVFLAMSSGKKKVVLNRSAAKSRRVRHNSLDPTRQLQAQQRSDKRDDVELAQIEADQPAMVYIAHPIRSRFRHGARAFFAVCIADKLLSALFLVLLAEQPGLQLFAMFIKQLVYFSVLLAWRPMKNGFTFQVNALIEGIRVAILALLMLLVPGLYDTDLATKQRIAVIITFLHVLVVLLVLALMVLKLVLLIIRLCCKRKQKHDKLDSVKDPHPLTGALQQAQQTAFVNSLADRTNPVTMSNPMLTLGASSGGALPGATANPMLAMSAPTGPAVSTSNPMLSGASGPKALAGPQAAALPIMKLSAAGARALGSGEGHTRTRPAMDNEPRRLSMKPSKFSFGQMEVKSDSATDISTLLGAADARKAARDAVPDATSVGDEADTAAAAAAATPSPLALLRSGAASKRNLRLYRGQDVGPKPTRMKTSLM
jgi:large-conductance mechanosensitive channel